MKSRTTINLVLLGATACLALLLTLTSNNAKQGTPRRLTSIDPTSVTSITIKPRNGSPISIKRTGNNWRLGQDGVLRANRYRLNSILELLQTPLISSLSPDNLDLQTFDLDRPLLELTLDDAVFHFGAEAPLGQGRYVLYDNRINIIADKLYPQLQQDLPFFVSTALFDGDDPPVRISCYPPAAGTPDQDLHEIDSAWQGLQATRVTGTRQAGDATGLLISTRSGKSLHIIPKSNGEELVLSVPEYGMAYHYPAATATGLGLTGMECLR